MATAGIASGFVAVVYFVLCSLLSYFVERLQKRIAIIR